MLFLSFSALYILAIQTVSAKPISLGTISREEMIRMGWKPSNSTALSNSTAISGVDGGTLSCPPAHILDTERIPFNHTDGLDAIHEFCVGHKSDYFKTVKNLDLSAKWTCDGKPKPTGKEPLWRGGVVFCETSLLQVIDGCDSKGDPLDKRRMGRQKHGGSFTKDCIAWDITQHKKDQKTIDREKQEKKEKAERLRKAAENSMAGPHRCNTWGCQSMFDVRPGN